MKNQLEFAVTVRALIVDRGELLMVKHDPMFSYYALPGGKPEIGEHLTAALAREMKEELNVKADVGNLLIVNDWVSLPTDHRIEFFFWINNAATFRHADIVGATHGFELADAMFGDPTDPKFQLLPSFLRTRFADIARLGNDFPTELLRSSTEAKY